MKDKIPNNSGLVYTTTFKLVNVTTDSQYIELAKDAWIETKAEFKGKPENFPPQLFFAPNHSELGLTKFYDSLLDSKIIIGTRHTGAESENNPFDLHECSYIALAISLLSDYWFVAGIESFSNNKTQDNPSMGPWTSFFMGKKKGQVEITLKDEKTLKENYNFIFQSLRSPTFNEKKAKLLFMYLRCIVYPPDQHFVALKMGIPSLLNEKTAIIVNSSLFFEHVFTSIYWTSKKGEKGVVIWNKEYPDLPMDFEDEINIVMNYRHTIVHDTAEFARKKIEKWQQKHGIPDEEILERVKEIAVCNVKNITRKIIKDYEKYESYQLSFPK
jgi:hypothetical protein